MRQQPAAHAAEIQLSLNCSNLEHMYQLLLPRASFEKHFDGIADFFDPTWALDFLDLISVSDVNGSMATSISNSSKNLLYSNKQNWYSNGSIVA